MSVENVEVIDAIGVDRETGEVVLTITDHLDWSTNENEHLMLLQEKINAYLEFILGGELVEAYEDAKGRRPRIDVIHKFPPSSMAVVFFSRVVEVAEASGVAFRYRGL
jgi:hypothetical protein